MPTSREPEGAPQPIHPIEEIDEIDEIDCGAGATPDRSEQPATWADRGDVDAPAWTWALPPGAWVLRAAFRASPGPPDGRRQATGS